MQEPLMNHHKAIVQYIKKERKSRSGKHVLSREKIGVLVAAPDVRDPKRVLIGFSLKHRKDDFDYVDGKRIPKHGIDMATTRAERWVNRDLADVPLPDSIKDDVTKFIIRCAKYYKGTQLPAWAREIYSSDAVIAKVRMDELKKQNPRACDLAGVQDEAIC